MKRALFLAILSVGGCNDSLPENAPPVQKVSGCVVPEGGWQAGDGPQVGMPFELSVTGMVVDSGVGSVPDGCFSGAYLGYDSDAGEQAQWFMIDDAGDRWTVAIALPNFVVPDTDEAVELVYRHTIGGFGPDVGELELQADAGVTWIGIAGGLDGLTPPSSLVLAQGAAVFEAADDCGRWQGYDVQVEVAGVEHDLPYGQVVAAGDLYLVHGGYQQTISQTTQCADWYVANIRIGATAKVDSLP